MRRLLAPLCFSLLLAAIVWAGQVRQRPAQPPKSLVDTFEGLRKEAETSAAVGLTSEKVAAEARSSALADLQQELPRLIEQARDLQAELARTDLRSKMPADLARRGKELEHLARKINKTVRDL